MLIFYYLKDHTASHNNENEAKGHTTTHNIENEAEIQISTHNDEDMAKAAPQVFVFFTYNDPLNSPKFETFSEFGNVK